MHHTGSRLSRAVAIVDEETGGDVVDDVVDDDGNDDDGDFVDGDDVVDVDVDDGCVDAVVDS